MAKTKYDVGKYDDSLGHELLNETRWLYWLIIVMITLMGALIGYLIGGPEDGAARAITCGIFSLIIGLKIAQVYTLFLDAKGELLLRTARIQEDLDYLCKVMDIELNQNNHSNNRPN